MVLWLKYEPQELVDTSNLGNEEWLSYRRRGIGGSDAAAILGISPWRTARDLYYDKLSVVKADMDENWVALEMGHLLENLVARIFAKKTGLRIFQRKVMFQHPLYPWMLADLDYLVELPDGSNAILEIKTTNYNARENWWYNGEEIVPVYYESQGRHYMSVMNLDRVYFCCLYGNNEDEVIIRHLDRDYAYESELIALEDTFWNNNVQKQCPPDYTESGDLILQSLQRWKGIDRKDLPPAAFGAPQVTQIHQYLQLQEEKNALAKQVTQLDTQMQQLKGLLVSELDGKDCATCADGEQSYVIFRLHDRVMQTKNNYSLEGYDSACKQKFKGVFNGDIGSICKILPDKLCVDFDGRVVEYSKNQLGDLELAYAITIHKSMGSEYETVIIPMLMAHRILLTKNLIYTAVTRAKKRVILVGQKRALFLAIHSGRKVKRNTCLAERILKYNQVFRQKALPQGATEQKLKKAG